MFLGTAWGDCGAWLLWNVYNNSERRGVEKAIHAAYESKKDCEAAIQAAVVTQLGAWAKMYEQIRRDPLEPSTVIATDHDATGKTTRSLLIHTSCWPLGVTPSIGAGAEYPTK